MNEREAIKKVYDLPDAEDAGCLGKYVSDIEALIVEVYDDFESRICENCCYLEYSERDDGTFYCPCINKESPEDDGFGCNKFKRKA